MLLYGMVDNDTQVVNERGESTHTEEAVDERVVAGVTHRQPVTAQPDDVDKLVSKKRNMHILHLSSVYMFSN